MIAQDIILVKLIIMRYNIGASYNYGGNAMTNQDIETFFAVLDHGTMTAAAEALFITQPSLSARLRALESFLISLS